MQEQWIRRRGGKTRFRYEAPNGRAVADAETLARIAKLRVPPAWRDVHIAPTPARAIQAWGFDVRGRKQYRYNDRAVRVRELRKHYRARQLGKSLPAIRRSLRRASMRRDQSASTVSAIALRLISETLFRPGGERYYRENGSHGITTLRKSHVSVEPDRVVFTYRGKSKQSQRHIVTNSELRTLVQRMMQSPGHRLFRYEADSSWCDLTAQRLMAYVRTLGRFAVKDFRTWGATLRAAIVLAELGPAKSETEAKRNVAIAMRIVASELGNTPAICRSSYVHPIVIARYVDAGDTITLRSLHPAPDAFAHSGEERALIRFLDRHFPERRKPSRTRILTSRAA
jgi:DNA topoisomerase-1